MRSLSSSSNKAHIATWLLSALLLLTLAGVASASPARGVPTLSPKPQTPLDNFPSIGMESFNNSLPAFQNIAGAGVQFVRMEIFWNQIEPVNTTPPNYNWSVYDPVFTNVISAGITPLVTIVGCPAWACVRDIGPLFSNMYGEAAQFMNAMAARYGQAPFNIHYWELWNEPDGAVGPNPGDHTWGWGAYPDRYATMLQNVYPAIKIADPDAVVLTGGVAYSNFWNEGGAFNPDFLPDVLADGGLSYFDAIAYHYYINDQRYANVGDKANAIRSVLGPGGQSAVFVCTEAGLTSDPQFGSSEALQARYIVKLYTWAAAAGVRSVTWYLDQDYNSPDPTHDIFAKSGIIRVDNTRKPSYTALNEFTRQVNMPSFLGALGPEDGLPAELEGYKFRTAPGNDANLNTWVVWSRSDITATLTIPSSQEPSVVRATSLQGDPLPLDSGTGGTLLLNVGPDPVYINIDYNPPRFSDVPYRYWAYDYVDYLASAGIVGGYADGTFHPGSAATRGQFAKMVALGMGWTLLDPPDATFEDVAPGSTFYQYIETAYNQGVVAGYTCGGPNEPCDPQSRPYFRQNRNITRAQIAKIIVGAKGWTLISPDTPTFTDIPYGSTFYQFIETAVARGILSGYTCGGPNEPCDPQSRPYFRPGSNATRAQLSKMLALALQQQ